MITLRTNIIIWVAKIILRTMNKDTRRILRRLEKQKVDTQKKYIPLCFNPFPTDGTLKYRSINMLLKCTQQYYCSCLLTVH